MNGIKDWKICFGDTYPDEPGSGASDADFTAVFDFTGTRQEAEDEARRLSQQMFHGDYIWWIESADGSLIWNNLQLRSVLDKKLHTWFAVCENYSPPGVDRATFLGDKQCPVCSMNKLWCLRNNFSSIDYEIRFAHVCLNPECDYVKEDKIEGVSFPDVETNPKYCPWCSEESKIN